MLIIYSCCVRYVWIALNGIEAYFIKNERDKGHQKTIRTRKMLLANGLSGIGNSSRLSLATFFVRMDWTQEMSRWNWIQLRSEHEVLESQSATILVAQVTRHQFGWMKGQTRTHWCRMKRYKCIQCVKLVRCLWLPAIIIPLLLTEWHKNWQQSKSTI